jgi:hypothetical protein
MQPPHLTQALVDRHFDADAGHRASHQPATDNGNCLGRPVQCPLAQLLWPRAGRTEQLDEASSSSSFVLPITTSLSSPDIQQHDKIDNKRESSSQAVGQPAQALAFNDARSTVSRQEDAGVHRPEDRGAQEGVNLAVKPWLCKRPVLDGCPKLKRRELRRMDR